jgi:hypothetical protein
VDLFGGQDMPPAPVKPVEPLWGAVGVTWKKTPAGHHLCQDCVALIHGRADGPQPLAAVTRRCGPNGELLLCHAHAQDHRDADAAAERQYADRIAAQKAAQKAVVSSKGYGRRREHA